MSVTVEHDDGGAPSAGQSLAPSALRGQNIEGRASYRKMLSGFVTGLDDMLNEWCANNADSPSSTMDRRSLDSDTPLPTASGTVALDSQHSSPGGSLDDFVGDENDDSAHDDSGSDDEDEVDGAEDYNAPSIAANYNYHTLLRSDELTTVERLHASSELWFYPTLSRADALRMLEHKEVGVFMVRNSSKPGNYALSMRQEDPNPYIQHYLIQQKRSGLQVQGAEHYFDSLEDLIAHYCDYISGGMPTNVILPISVAEPSNRQSLLLAMEKESAMLKLLETSVLNPGVLTSGQVSCLQAGITDIRHDTTRVCPPRASFQKSVRMPLIQSQFVPTPKTSLTCPPGSMSLTRGDVAPPPLPRDKPPVLPPKRNRYATSAMPHPQVPRSRSEMSPNNTMSSSPRSAEATPPPLPPKQKTLKTKKTPPPIPHRAGIPGTLSEEEDNIEEQMPARRMSSHQRRYTISSLDRKSLARTRANSDEVAAEEANLVGDLDKDEDGYLLPVQIEQAAATLQQQQPPRHRTSTVGSIQRENGSVRPSSRSSGSHAYIDIDQLVMEDSSPSTSPLDSRGTAQTTPSVHIPNSKRPSVDDDNLTGAKVNGKAQRILGMDDPEPRRASAPKVNPSAWIKNRAANLSVMSRFGKTATERVVIGITKYAASKNTVLGQNIDVFLTTANSKPHDDNPVKFAEEIRGFMNSLKGYLLGPGRQELNEIIARSYDFAGGTEINVQFILEKALHKAVLKPLKPLVYKSFIDNMSRDGTLANLRNCMKAGKRMTPADLGVRERLIPPQGPSLHQIGQHLVKMQKAISPNTKIQHMLDAIKTIYKSVKDTQSEIANEQLVLGADDFLPMMVYVLCQLEVWKMGVETEYLWALLDNSLTVGEGGYYLTTMSSAVHAIGSLASQPAVSPEPAVLTSSSSSAKLKQQISSASMVPNNTSRKPGQGSDGDVPSSNVGYVSSSSPPLSMVSPTTGDVRLPCIADMQGFMRIHIDDPSGRTLSVHTLPVTVDTTVADTCRMVAKKFDIKEPERFGLYQVEGKKATLLKATDKPQLIKADWLADSSMYGQVHPGVERYFGYRQQHLKH
ncbi:protein sprint-like isoform X1 [Sycon ciliatum]|uniref:protein sprint-like isoform X1 n=2 Tax=Sycon ciliatum TaxID=27933 RepID=UPI0031F6899F